MNLIRICPNCGDEIICSSIKAKNVAQKRGSTCKKCVHKNKKLTEEHRKNITEGMKSSNKVKANAEIQKITFKGEGNPNFGKSLNEDQKKKLSEYAKSRIGDKNPFFGKSHTNNSRSSISSTRAEGIANGKIQTRYHNTGIHLSTKTMKEERYDSKLELYRMLQMDGDPTIKSWTKTHGIKIAYNDKDVIRNYVPDFLVLYTNGESYIEEVKGYDTKAHLKLSVLENYCKNERINFKWHWQDDKIFENYKKWLKQ